MRSAAAEQWGHAMKESGALCSAILRVAHPEFYAAGRKAFERASAMPAVRDALGKWPSIFSAVEVISNRETPYHRDTSGFRTMMEFLITMGDYDLATLVVRNLGMQLVYKSGTGILLTIFVLHHGVASVPADRICYAWFTAEALLTNHDIPPIPWMTQSYYHTK